MVNRRIMLIGPTGCGKTTLANILNTYEGPLRKTQDMMFGEHTIDVPGSYLENPWMYRHLISAAQNHAGHILVLVDQSAPRDIGSPGFARVFNCPVAGVVTKCDLNPENESHSFNQLERLGVERPYFKVTAADVNKMATGLEELKTYLAESGGIQ